MPIEFNPRKKDRRKTPCFIEKDRRKADRRGKAQRDIDRKRRVEFERHLAAQK